MEEEQEQEEAPPPEEPFYEPAKGSVGRELELVFDDLYPDNSVNLARTQLAGGTILRYTSVNTYST